MAVGVGGEYMVPPARIAEAFDSNKELKLC